MNRFELSEEHNGETIKASCGDVVVVTLPENGTTGYGWRVEDARSGMPYLLASEYVAAEGKGIGAGGHRVITFRADEPGLSLIRIKLGPLWAPTSAGFHEYAVKVVVEPPES